MPIVAYAFQDPGHDAGNSGPGWPAQDHPAWCSRPLCTVAGTTGSHRSAPLVVDRSGSARTELSLESWQPGDQVLILIERFDGFEEDDPDEPSAVIVFQLAEARRLHERLGRLIATAAAS